MAARVLDDADELTGPYLGGTDPRSGPAVATQQRQSPRGGDRLVVSEEPGSTVHSPSRTYGSCAIRLYVRARRAFVLTEDPTYAQAWWTAVEDCSAASRGALAFRVRRPPVLHAGRPPCWLGFSETVRRVRPTLGYALSQPNNHALSNSGSRAATGIPVDVSLVLSPSRVAPDGTFPATLNGCSTGEVATFTVTGDSATDTSASPATATLTAPAAPGSYAVTGAPPRCRQARRSRSQRPELVHPARARADYATTSSDSVPLAQIGSGVLLAGIGLVAVTRYRRWSVSAT